jgi:hypothetical protein
MVTFVVILEKESNTGASTRKLVLPEVPESWVVDNWNLQETSNGPVCHLFRVYWRPDDPIRLRNLKILDREVEEPLGGKGGCIKKKFPRSSGYM